ncbi:MAG: glycogen/starch/alpha-glucan phosphorylase, partial [Actinomycetota bacterium]
DEPGKAMIQAIEQFARELDVAHRFVFVQDYDMHVARMMYRGCDVWLNTPRRPLEACGTSGMKAAMNGALNCSIADG